jgi:putative ABC transport system permease protein
MIYRGTHGTPFVVFWRDRVFAVTAFLTLGVGVASTVAMLTVVDAVLLRPLPFRAAHRLVGVISSDTRNAGTWR